MPSVIEKNYLKEVKVYSLLFKNDSITLQNDFREEHTGKGTEALIWGVGQPT